MNVLLSAFQLSMYCVFDCLFYGAFVTSCHLFGCLGCLLAFFSVFKQWDLEKKRIRSVPAVSWFETRCCVSSGLIYIFAPSLYFSGSRQRSVAELVRQRVYL